MRLYGLVPPASRCSSLPPFLWFVRVGAFCAIDDLLAMLACTSAGRPSDAELLVENDCGCLFVSPMQTKQNLVISYCLLFYPVPLLMLSIQRQPARLGLQRTLRVLFFPPYLVVESGFMSTPYCQLVFKASPFSRTSKLTFPRRIHERYQDTASSSTE